MLEQNTTAPVGTAAHKLCPHGALFSARLGVQRPEWMLNIITTGEFRTLNRDEVFIFASASLEHKPVHLFISLVLVSLNEIPPEDEMLGDVVYTVADQTHANVMPWHTAVF